jgi:mono/diheme cytochrome c family protein
MPAQIAHAGEKAMPNFFILAFPALLTALAGAGAEGPHEAAIRAGHNIAVGNCVGCHVVSPSQTIKPVLGPGIPSFQDIANRPDTTAEALQGAMKTARWHDPGMAATLLPMSRLSDKERAEVASYILSLRAQP